MTRVNLLPHREMRRRRQRQQFFTMLGVVVAAGVAIWFMVHTSLTGTYEDQLSRNKYLTDEIAKLDKELEDIKKLQELTASLNNRKKAVEELQSNRAQVVHLMEELTRQLPDGVYLKGIKQTGTKVSINGYTQSQARVSTLMRNLENSPYLENANLVEIKAVTTPARINEFILTVTLERPKGTEPEKKPAPKTAATAPTK